MSREGERRDASGCEDDDPSQEEIGTLGPSMLQVGKVDAEFIRGSVASKLFGVAADPVKIGRFTVLKRLGAGGMGVVYAAYDDQLDRKVAVKLLRSAVHGEEQHARLLREAQSLAKLSHPNVIHVYEVGSFRGQVFVAMEFVAGKTLREYEPEGGDRLASVLEVYRQAGQGLAAAHEAGLVHRDFKPDNVLVGDDGRVRVLDFGLARGLHGHENDASADAGDGNDGIEVKKGPIGPETAEELARRLASSDGLTRTGAIMGTPAYMAPEQFRGAVADARTDQFSFCVSLWEKLYGRRPFAGDDAFALALAASRGEIAEPETDAGVPRWLRQVLEKGMSVDPDDRFPAMTELLDRLEPNAPSRRWWLPVAVVVGLGLGGAAVAYGMAEQPDACLGGAEKINGIWDDARRSRVETSFRESGAEDAQEAWQSTRRELDSYAKSWAAAHQTACEASREGADDGTELYGRRLVCLGQRLNEVDALIRLLEGADADSVRQAVLASSSLPSVEACLDEASLTRSFPEPEVMKGAQYEEFEKLLARGAGHIGLAEYEDALEVATRAVEAADLLDHARARARAELLLGRAHLENRENELARQRLQASLRQADKAGDDETRTRATIYLVREATQSGDYERAESIAADAVALLERVGELPLLEAELYKQWGNLALYAKQTDEAIERHRRSLELSEIHLGDDHVAVGVSLTNLGMASASKDPIEARRHFERAITIFENHLGSHHPHIASASVGIGNSLVEQASALGTSDRPRAQRLRSEAGPHYRRAIEIRSAVHGADHVASATARHNYAEVLRETGRPREALTEYEQVIDVRRKALGGDHPELAMSLVGIGLVRIELGAREVALENLEEARRILEKDMDDPLTANVGELYSGLAMALEPDDHARALEYATRARDNYRAAGPKRAVALARIEAWLAEHGGSKPSP